MTTINIKKMQIEIAEHSPYWKLTYQKEEQRILKFLKAANIPTKIAHIGSTSVPNLSAKPTIDVLLGLRKEEDLEACIPVFKKLGYVYISKYNEVMPFRRFFIKIKAKNPLQKWKEKEVGPDDLMPLRQSYARQFHIHVVQQDTDFYARHVAFRNHLKKNIEDLRAYEALKIHLGALDWASENDYAQAKSTFINGIMEKLGFENS
jgi:GrpB-like predicted nucleotidyltransferase (UPF0157 family)